MYVPPLAATVTIPLASMLNGPVVNGVTLVLVVVARPLNVSMSPSLRHNSYRWIVASTGLFTTTMAVAVSQFAGLTFNLLMDWLRIIGR
jgi:hypothetical protein